MKMIHSFLLIFTLALSSCTSFTPDFQSDRSIANEVTSPLSLEELMTIKSSAETTDEGLFSQTKKSVTYGTGANVKFIEDPKMSSDIAFKIVPTIEDKINYTINVYHSSKAILDKGAQAELTVVLNQFPSLARRENTKFTSVMSLYELYYNMAQEDFTSLQTMAKLRKFAADTSYAEESAEARLYWEKINKQFDSGERVLNKTKKAKTLERKAVMDILDKVSDDQQFRALVAKNDRKGVAKLISSYLPWEEMPPFEKLFWQTHLTIMTDPLPVEDRILVYRGIDGDIVQPAEVNGVKLTREEAIKEQKVFLMSTMLTKNQGTWNRRLRSLTAMYDKFIGTDNTDKVSEFTGSARISNMFYKHSRSPNGSPFLSYTPDFIIANEFGTKSNTAYFIDPRLMYFNMASSFTQETEVLLPLVSFPDELAAIYDNKVHGYNDNIENFLREKTIAKLDELYGTGKGSAILTKINNNTNKFFSTTDSGKIKLNHAFHPDPKFVEKFKSIIGTNSAEASKIINNGENLGCADIIQLFWK